MEHVDILRRGDPEEIRLALKVAQTENLVDGNSLGVRCQQQGMTRAIDEWSDARVFVEGRRFDLAAYQELRGYVRLGDVTHG